MCGLAHMRLSDRRKRMSVPSKMGVCLGAIMKRLPDGEGTDAVKKLFRGVKIK